MKTIAGFFSIVLLYVLTGCNSKIGSSQSLQVLDKDSKVLYDKYQLDKIILPPGFSISVFAEVPNARSLCRGSKGSIFVGNRSGDKVYAVVDENNDGKADKRYVIDEGLNQPNGVAFRNGSLYVAEISRILRYDDIENRLANPPEPVVIYDKYPT
jgi:glucose/arabinose dehydrogenase